MKKSLLVIMLMSLMSAVSFAQVNFSHIRFALESEYVPGFGRIFVTPKGHGKLEVVHDTNVCGGTSPFLMCTQMAPQKMTVIPEVVRDSRPVDGDLVLSLTDKLQLSVGSGFNPEGKIYIHVIDLESNKYVKLTPLISGVVLK